MSQLDNDDDLDALLDDCLNTMDEQERKHEEEVQARVATRVDELGSGVSGPCGGDEAMMRLLQSFMEGVSPDGDADLTGLEDKLRSQLDEIASMIEGMPDVTSEDRQSLEQVRQLVDMLKEDKPQHLEGDAGRAHSESDQLSEEEIKALSEVSELLTKLGGGAEDGVPNQEGEGRGVDELSDPSAFAAKALTDVLRNPELLEPLRQLRDAYPRWLAANESTTSAEDLARYKRQHELAVSICEHIETSPITDGDDERVQVMLSLLHEYSSLASLPPGLTECQPDKPAA
uniref:Uncharacterized protein TCIL3000_9_5070 n=1 Tax=Trypanosoma congolense (strain IL3000) TaxID=1068625 RepID=G0UUN7_TRYCI|nr:unnamed protein product [Trypanosoma congolense IL3000]